MFQKTIKNLKGNLFHLYISNDNKVYMIVLKTNLMSYKANTFIGPSCTESSWIEKLG